MRQFLAMFRPRLSVIILLTVFQYTCYAYRQAPGFKWLEYEENVVGPFDPSKGFLLLKLEQAEDFLQLNKSGLRVIRKLDEKTAIVQSSAPGVVSRLPSDAHLSSANNLWKLSANITNKASSYSKATYALKSLDAEKTLSRIRNVEVKLIKRVGDVLWVKGSQSYVRNNIIAWDEVVYIGKESLTAQPESRVLDMNLNPNGINLVRHHYPELDGTGRTISIKDLPYNIEDIDLLARNVPSELAGDEPSNHGTEMATIAAGAGNSSTFGFGVAPGALITSSDLVNLLPDPDDAFATLDAWVQNHSYGTEIENFYGATAEAFDQSTNRNPSLLHVFSVGNQGLETSPNGQYQGLENTANITGNFKMSKNTLVVGSVDTTGSEVTFVSRGPAYDGRVKPELVSYSVFGSSNSAALVSGSAILLQQAYEEEFDAIPASALVKALLINGAEDVYNPGPDYVTGFGDVRTDRSIELLRRGNFQQGQVTANDGSATFDISIPEGAVNFKATLVWNDPAATANSNVALVNDLDFEVTDANAVAWQPWVLDPSVDNVNNPAVRGVDRLNNIEQITIAAPAAGSMRLNVNAATLATATQDFYIVYSWEMANEFMWRYPTGSDNMPFNGETTGYFRWNSTLTAATGRLEISYDDGANWELIAAEVPLDRGYLRWEAPLITSTAQARMVVGAANYTSDAFTVHRPDFIDVGFNCTDSVRLQWRSVEGAASYEILNLGSNALDQVATVTDTSFTFLKRDFASPSFAVQPVLANGQRPLRGLTVNYNFRGTGCYLIGFLQELSPDEGVFLNLQLGTTAGVSAIVFERKNTAGEFEEINSLAGADLSSELRVLDDQPFQGLNTHRATVFFENGEQLTTEPASVYFLSTQPFLIFPNPVNTGEDLRIFTKALNFESGVEFTLFDNAGNRLFTEPIISDRNFYNLDRLKPGLYFYRISAEGYTEKGRVLISE